MTPADRAIVAAAEERDRAAAKAGWLRQTDPGKLSAHGDRHELLRIVHEQEAATKGVVAADYVDEPLAGDPADRADAAAAERATAGKWGG